MDSHASRGLTRMAALTFGVAVLYASLYPFVGWRWPPGRDLADLLALPWPPYRVAFDIVSNLLGYLPLGLLVALAARSGRLGAAAAWGLATVTGAALSYGVEVAQHFLPGRHPSLLDLALNAAGAALGGALALGFFALGWPQRLGQASDRWLAPDAAPAVVLLLSWPAALLFPTAVPLGLGQIGPYLRPLLAGWLEDVPWAETWYQALAVPPTPPGPAQPLAEALITALGLLLPCLLAYVVVERGWRRLILALGAPLVAGATLTLSTALNFGPEHALTWMAPGRLPALVLGTLLALACAALPRRLSASLGLVVITAGVMLTAQVPVDPYVADSLQAWEQGKFIRFHGLAQWLGWLWPYAAGLWLLLRAGQRP